MRKERREGEKKKEKFIFFVCSGASPVVVIDTLLVRQISGSHKSQYSVHSRVQLEQ